MDDLIRRGAVLGKLDELSELFRRRGETEDKGFLAVQCGVMHAVEEVKEAPSVDAVEVVHARWIEEPMNIPHCSRCGLYSDDADYGRANYCPGCGAHMDAEVISEMETTTREKEAKQDG